MRLLIVEDSQLLRDSLAHGLRKLGHVVDGAADGATGLWFAQGNDYDAIILDLMLPGMQGIQLLKTLRAAGNGTAVLILSARDTTTDKVAGLREGADDYLVKPFSFDELVARVEAITRRNTPARTSILSCGPLSVNTAAHAVMLDGKKIDVTAREYATLELLMRRQGSVVTREQIEGRLYQGDIEIMSNVVDAIVYSLRRKLEHAGAPNLIYTQRGLGYELRSADE
jgi:DNA-binding response OmpR family regulator